MAMGTPYATQAVRVLPDSVSFVAALLVQFPQFASAAFDPRRGVLRLSLLVGKRLPARARAAFRRRLEDSIAVLRELQGGLPPRAEVRWQAGPNFTRFELVRSTDDLTLEEVRVVARLAQEAFGDDLLDHPDDRSGISGDPGAPVGGLFRDRLLRGGESEEEAEEELRYALEHARHLRPSRPVVGVREGGRVLVYYAPRAARRVRERSP
jgi:hypothetical protein